MQTRIPAILMRGGTSKGLFFHENHLPSSPALRDSVILSAYGSPDPYGRQTDGLGGAVSTTSKVAIVSPSTNPEFDVEYTFGQVSIDRPLVDYKGNCGNILSAVGPFAIDEGLVKAIEPVTEVRILQKNTGKIIVAEIPVRNGVFEEEGNQVIPGVPGSASKIVLRFLSPGGSVTGKLFPTGHLVDFLSINTDLHVPVTIMDASNPLVFVQASSIGLTGTEIEKIENDPTTRSMLETIRGHAAVLAGLATSPEEASKKSQAVPKIAVVAPPQTYQATDGKKIDDQSFDLLVRMMSMNTLHRTIAVSGAICTSGAAMVQGTVVHAAVNTNRNEGKHLRLGHPGGIIGVGVKMENQEGTWYYREATVTRTARRLMEGYVLVPRKVFSSQYTAHSSNSP